MLQRIGRKKIYFYFYFFSSFPICHYDKLHNSPGSKEKCNVKPRPISLLHISYTFGFFFSSSFFAVIKCGKGNFFALHGSHALRREDKDFSFEETAPGLSKWKSAAAKLFRYSCLLQLLLTYLYSLFISSFSIFRLKNFFLFETRWGHLGEKKKKIQECWSLRVLLILKEFWEWSK